MKPQMYLIGYIITYVFIINVNVRQGKIKMSSKIIAGK